MIESFAMCRTPVKDLVRRYYELSSSVKDLEIHSREFQLTIKILSELRYQIDKKCTHVWEGKAPNYYVCLDCGIAKE